MVTAPTSISKYPGRCTSPLTQTIRVPVLFGRPSRAYSAPPIAMMCFTWQSVSTLFTMVGHM